MAPFDGTTAFTKETVEQETRPDLSKPSLAGLSYLLRHLSEEKPDHIWDFGICGGAMRSYNGHRCGSAGCAMGLALSVWHGSVVEGPAITGIPVYDCQYLFSAGAYDIPYDEVTPAMVADRIDAYLAERLAGKP